MTNEQQPQDRPDFVGWEFDEYGHRSPLFQGDFDSWDRAAAERQSQAQAERQPVNRERLAAASVYHNMSDHFRGLGYSECASACLVAEDVMLGVAKQLTRNELFQAFGGTAQTIIVEAFDKLTSFSRTATAKEENKQ